MAEYTGKIVKRNTKYDLNLPPLDGRNNMSEAGDFDEPPPFHGEVGALDARLTAGMKKGSSEYTGKRVRKPTPETNPTSRISMPEDGSVIQDLKNFGAGALSLTRGALNIGNEAYNDTKRHTNPAIAPAKQKLQPKEMLGDKLLLPKGTDKESGAYGFGTILDPASLAIGGGVSKILPYAPVTGGSFKQGVTALGKNMLSGGVTGGIIGGLSDDGNAVDGAMAGAVANVAIPALLKTGEFFGKKGFELFDPILSIEGKQRAAARVANAAAGNTGNKAQIAELLTKAELGQTASDVALTSRNSEIIALQKLVGSTNPSLIDADEIARKRLAQYKLGTISKSPADRALAEIQVEKAGNAYDKIKATTVKSDAKLDAITQSPAFKIAERKASKISENLNAELRAKGLQEIPFKTMVPSGKFDKNLQPILVPEYSAQGLQHIKGVMDDLAAPNTIASQTGTLGTEKVGYGKVRTSLVDWMNKNISGWESARKGYASAKQVSNRMGIGKQLENSYISKLGSERIEPFGTAVRKIETDINKKTGKPIIDELIGSEKASIRDVTKQFENEKQMEELGKKGTQSALKTLRATESVIQSVPNRLSFETTAFNALIKAIQGHGGEKTNRELASLMYTNPKLLGELMKNGQTPNAKIKKVTDALMRIQAASIANYTQQGEQ